MDSVYLQMNELLLTLYGTRNKEEAFQKTLDALKEIIPFDKGDIYFFDSSCEQPKINVFLSNGWETDELDQYLNHFYQIDDVLPLISSRKSIMFRSSDIFAAEDRMKSAYYLKALKPLGMEYSIEGSICCVGNIIGGIGLHRDIKKEEFTAEDVAFMKILASHLRNVARDYLMSAEDLPQIKCLNAGLFVSYVLWDVHGSIEFENLEKVGISSSDKPNIMDQLFVIGRKLTNKKETITQSISIKSKSEEKSMLASRGFFVTVNKLLYNSKQHYCAVIIDFSKIVDAAFDSMQDTINLTKRELEVIRLAMNGVETTDIAKTFCVDVSTVKKHLTNSYQKMEIKGKHQIINFLLRGGNDMER